MRLAFLGTPAAAVPSLRALAHHHEVCLVGCQPDRAAGRGRLLHEPAVKVVARELGLRVEQPESIKTGEFRQVLETVRPDLVVVVAYGRILGPKLLGVAPHGTLNVHFSLLPRWRGAAPVQRAILAGDATTGVSTMRLIQELDAGPVFLQEATSIGPDEHAPSLEARLADIGAALLLRTLQGIAEGTLVARPQDPRAVTLAPPLVKGEGGLDPRQAAALLARRVRALDPWPGTRLARPDGGGVAVLEARVGSKSTDAAPGTILALQGDDLPLACGEGTVLLLANVRPAGRTAMTGRAAVNGHYLVPGETLVAPEAEAAGRADDGAGPP